LSVASCCSRVGNMTKHPSFQPAALAALVRDARLKLGLSQNAVAKATGLSREWLRLLEAGERPTGGASQPKPENIRALALVLRVDETTALTLAGHDPDAPVDAIIGRPSCSEAAFNVNVNRLPSHVRMAVMALVEAVADDGAAQPSGDRPKKGAAA
jgi:transcriptional regulator with XRE-family HTH domain